SGSRRPAERRSQRPRRRRPPRASSRCGARPRDGSSNTVASLFRWGGRGRASSSSPASKPAAVQAACSAPSKVLPKLLQALRTIDAPVLSDPGPACGANISSLGEELGCRTYVEDLFAVVEVPGRAGTRAQLVDVVAAKLTPAVASV